MSLNRKDFYPAALQAMLKMANDPEAIDAILKIVHQLEHFSESAGAVDTSDISQIGLQYGRRLEEAKRDYSCLYFRLPEDTAGQLQQLARRIKDADLAHHGREDDPHITLLYGLHTQDPEDVADLIGGAKPPVASLGQTVVFPASETGQDYDVVAIGVEGEDLHWLHRLLDRTMDYEPFYPEYKPHVTLAYVKPGMGAKYASLLLDPQEVELNDLIFSSRDRVKTSIPLSARMTEAKKAKAKAGDDEVQDDPEAFAEMIAEILYGLYGKDALKYFAIASEDDKIKESRLWEAWNPLDHPRGAKGRFITKGSPEAVATAKSVVGRVLKGDKTPESAEEVASHLAILSVKQLYALHKEHGQKIPYGLRAQLIEAVKSRLPTPKNEEKAEDAKEKVEEKPTPTPAEETPTEKQEEAPAEKPEESPAEPQAKGEESSVPAETPATEPEATAKKEPWEMTADEYADLHAGKFDTRSMSLDRDKAKKEHARIISDRVLDNQDVPAERLTEYPHLDMQKMTAMAGEVAAKMDAQKEIRRKLTDARERRLKQLEDMRRGSEEAKRQHDAEAISETLADYLDKTNLSSGSKAKILAARSSARGFRVDSETGATVEVPGGSSWYLPHYEAVKSALAAGKLVPAEVLADYPDLQAKYGKSEPATEPAKPEPAAEAPAVAGPEATPAKEPEAAPTPKEDEPGFTGKDSLGREWVDGKLVAREPEAKADHANTEVGDEITYTPHNSKYEDTITGHVAEKIMSGNGTPGYNLHTPTPDDPQRTTRIWLDKGSVAKTGKIADWKPKPAKADDTPTSTNPGTSLTGMHKEAYDSAVPTMEREVGKETALHRKATAAAYMMTGEPPAVQKALAERFKQISPEGYEYMRTSKSTPLGLKHVFDGVESAKPAEPTPQPSQREVQSEKPHYSVNDVAKLVQVAPRTIAKWRDSGKLPMTDGKVSAADLDTFLSDNGLIGISELEAKQRGKADFDARLATKQADEATVKRHGKAPPESLSWDEYVALKQAQHRLAGLPAPADAALHDEYDAHVQDAADRKQPATPATQTSKPLTGTPQEIRHRISDALASNRDAWTPDLDAYPVKVPTVAGLLKNGGGERYGGYTATAHDGYLTDGKIAMALPEKEKAKLPPSNGGRSLAGQIKEMLAAKTVSGPLKVTGAINRSGIVYRMLEDGSGKRQAVEGRYLEMIAKHHPGATFYLSGRNGIDGPIVAKKDGESVGIIMPLSQESIKGSVIRPAGHVPEGERIFDDLQPNGIKPEDVIVGGTSTKSKKKEFTVRHPDVGALHVQQDKAGGWTVQDIGAHGQTYGGSASKEEATALAKKLIAHAHGYDSNMGGLIFKPKEASSPPTPEPAASPAEAPSEAEAKSQDTGTPANPATKRDEPGFTGKDSLGRQWVDGKLVAAEKDTPATEQPKTKPEQPQQVTTEKMPAEPATLTSNVHPMDTGVEIRKDPTTEKPIPEVAPGQPKSSENQPSGVDSNNVLDNNNPGQSSTGETKMPRKISEITKGFVGLQKSLRNHAAGSEKHSEIMGKIMSMKNELQQALPPLATPAATSARERFVKEIISLIDATDREAVEADIMAERSPHMKAKADDARKQAAMYRTGLDIAAQTDDSDWWTKTMGPMTSAQTVAKGLAGVKGNIASMPKMNKTAIVTPNMDNLPERGRDRQVEVLKRIWEANPHLTVRQMADWWGTQDHLYKTLFPTGKRDKYERVDEAVLLASEVAKKLGALPIGPRMRETDSIESLRSSRW